MKDWWWVVVSEDRVAGFEYADCARRYGEEQYRSRFKLEQGPPDHLLTPEGAATEHRARANLEACKRLFEAALLIAEAKGLIEE